MSEKFNKRIYPVRDIYRFTEDALRTVKYLRKARQKGMMGDDFLSRIMLAVTEVNGCEMCSYHHAEVALQNGMSGEEIAEMLSGGSESVPPDQAVAVFFAQHYAESAGCPDREAWGGMVDVYGEEKSLAVLGAVRQIMTGNVYGIAAGALKDRFRGKPTGKTSFVYEFTSVAGILVILPVAFIVGKIKDMFKIPLLVFKT